MGQPTGIIKQAELDFRVHKQKVNLFNQIKNTLKENLMLLKGNNQVDIILKALKTLNQLLGNLSRDESTLSRSIFEATQLDTDLQICKTVGKILVNIPDLKEITNGLELYTELIISCSTLFQSLILFCPTTSEYFLKVSRFKLIFELIKVSQPNVALVALETILCLLATSPEHVRLFEKVDGLIAIASVAKNQNLPNPIRLKCMELLCLYLKPEGTADSKNSNVKLRTSTAKQEDVVKIFGEAFLTLLTKVVVY